MKGYIMGAFLQGFTVGLAYVMPIGAQNIFVINTALTHKASYRWMTSFIVIFFDVTISLACFYGVGTIMESNKWLQLIILGLGSLIVMWIGFSIFRDKSGLQGDQGKEELPILKVISTACVVTWFNPQAWIDGSMMLGAFRVSMDQSAGAVFITGVCLASVTWWIVMPTLVSLLKSKINDTVFRWINIICGLIIMVYGVKLFVNFIKLLQVMF